MSYLGLDVGTTGCKAVVFDEHGKQIASAGSNYPVLSEREGRAELDSEQVLNACVEVIRETARSASGDPVRGIGISSQGEAFTPVGPNGDILCNAMVSSDSRATGIADRWSDGFGKERLYRITGHTASPMFTLFKLLWLKENRPDVWAGARAFYCFEELVHHRIGIEPAISWPLAGRTMLFDVIQHEWSGEILDAAGIDRSKLARTAPSGTVVGMIGSDVAGELGLPDGVIVVSGGHDQTCGALGAGVASADRAVYGIGTVECITPAFDQPVFSDELFGNNLATYDYTIGGMYTTVAYSLTGGNILQWFRDQFAHKEIEEAARTGEDVYDLLLRGIDEGRPSGLMVLPYLTPSGTPYFDTEVAGAITGLRLSTTRADLLKALLEGVTYEMRLNLDILRRSGIAVKELVAIGGGAKNLHWLRLKANVLNIPISRAAVTEAGCLGAAMLACAADTGEDVEHIAGRWVRISDVVEPQPDRAAYDECFCAYMKLYPALKTLT